MNDILSIQGHEEIITNTEKIITKLNLTKDSINKLYSYLKTNHYIEIQDLDHESKNNTVILNFNKLVFLLERSERIQCINEPDWFIDLLKQIILELREKHIVAQTINIAFKNFDILPTTYLGKLILKNSLVRTKASIDWFTPGFVMETFQKEYYCPGCNKIILSTEDKLVCKCKTKLDKTNLIQTHERAFKYVGLSAVAISESDEKVAVPAQMTCVMNTFADHQEQLIDKLTHEFVEVIGITRLRSKKKSKDKEIFIEILNIIPSKEGLKDITLNEEELEEFENLRENEENIVRQFAQDFFINISGWNEVKEGVMLQMFGSPTRLKNKLPIKRGNINVLIVSNPGEAKTEILRTVEKYFPRSYKVTANNSTTIGLTAGVKINEVTGERVLSKGAMFKATPGGLLLADEISEYKDRLNDLDDVLENNEFQVDKIVSMKKQFMDFSFLAATNPTNREWDQNVPKMDRIPLKPQNLQRFDLIFGMKTISDKEKVERVFDKLLENTEKLESKQKYSREYIVKYIAYARSIEPELPIEAKDRLKEFFLGIHSNSSRDEAIKSLPRQMMSATRLTLAHARANLRKLATVEDVEYALGLMIKTYQNFNLVQSYKSGTLVVDFDEMEFRGSKSPEGRASSKREIIIQAMRIIKRNTGDELVHHEDLMSTLETLGFTDKDSIEETIGRMSLVGELLKPRNKYYKLMG